MAEFIFFSLLLDGIGGVSSVVTDGVVFGLFLRCIISLAKAEIWAWYCQRDAVDLKKFEFGHGDFPNITVDVYQI